ncbi:MAG: hypothetical protein EOO79_06390, partial [Oxalobacteraceae bacterium]
QWGVRSKEFVGAGYNQLLLDDTDGQGRVRLRCTHAAASLDLGYLIHAADNYRGSFRGQGAELRTKGRFSNELRAFQLFHAARSR